MEKITAARALELLESVVEKHGADMTYTQVLEASGLDSEVEAYRDGGCEYVAQDNTTPLCIVGQVIHELGLPFPRGALRSDQPGSDDFRAPSTLAGEYLSRYYRDIFTEEAVEVLDRAQGTQDAGVSWGRALSDARDRARRYGWVDE